MSDKDLPEEELIDDSTIVEVEAEFNQIQDLLPKMNVSAPVPQQQEQMPAIIEAEELKALYDDIISGLKVEKEEIQGIQDKFEDMVMNDGDASSSSKEALVNLIKIKSDIADKLIKVADLKTRVVLKEKNTFPPYLAANQTNNTYINNAPQQNRRAILEAIEKNKKDNK
jgi:hypothetical protein